MISHSIFQQPNPRRKVVVSKAIIDDADDAPDNAPEEPDHPALDMEALPPLPDEDAEMEDAEDQVVPIFSSIVFC